MAYNLDYTSTADLLAAYKEERPATTFLKDRYFPDGVNFATNEVIVEYKKGRRVLAPFVSNVQRTHQTPGSYHGVRRGNDT